MRLPDQVQIDGEPVQPTSTRLPAGKHLNSEWIKRVGISPFPAAGIASHNNDLILNRARAKQRSPRRITASGPSRGNEQNLNLPASKRANQFRESEIVTDDDACPDRGPPGAK
jgi:hypothetical protein